MFAAGLLLKKVEVEATVGVISIKSGDWSSWESEVLNLNCKFVSDFLWEVIL